jgi:hypothetical protein
MTEGSAAPSGRIRISPSLRACGEHLHAFEDPAPCRGASYRTLRHAARLLEATHKPSSAFEGF